ncbi:RWD domain-containing protein [Schistosoma japonicum]|uniref:RWD domain-containing protein n=1 Tax=Schistosoma japonicum TaxID=6182 RepID=A0A4Z2DR83_SCHJA|nr:RWD domain-containing protein 2B [Schistosoma japonicum]KAH8876437.1 RWD domain-containing protein 2B [Schistosoma japonicum]KAH8876441.1 RWD domain-containing protein 2B [Schistosoma japonicum]KAH8876442.1 RWD domain-containing protein 2B [Schistosoma japonicum]KAH8876443.1 RWD domain-containing protein 2B [Schistosoma japonicum]
MIQSLKSKIDEVELLLSMFSEDEIQLGDVESYLNMKRHAELNVIPEKTDVDFVIRLKKKVELSVVLPNGYPSWNTSHPVKPLITLRLLSGSSSLHCINVRELSSCFNQFIDEISNTGEPILVACIDWLQNELTNKALVTDESLATLSANSILNNDTNERIICLWIISHHIRSPVKRRLILEWSKELKLTGCCMPGRPGLVIVEGGEIEAGEYWRRLRNLQWKHIQLREKEILGTGAYQIRRFQDGFHELMLSQQSWFSWLNEHHVTSDEYKHIFGIPGRLPQNELQ